MAQSTTWGRIDDEVTETVERLARALDTTAEELMLRAPSAWLERLPEPAADRAVLDPAECRRLLESEGVGRVGFSVAGGPAVLPVNYVFSRGRVIFRTTECSALAGLHGMRIAFEVDRIDYGQREGWSVLVTGRARTVHEPLVDLACASPQSWAGSGRDVFVVVPADRITGRRVGPSGLSAA